MIKKQYITYTTRQLAQEKGFSDFDHIALELNEKGDLFEYSTVEQYILQKWLRDQYDIHIQIRKENYVYKNHHCEYFHYDISKGQVDDITHQQDLYGAIMDECSQDIPGNYLNINKLSTLIFEKEFAFNTYEETLEKCLQQALTLIP
jgi:hypothetical protein